MHAKKTSCFVKRYVNVVNVLIILKMDVEMLKNGQVKTKTILYCEK